MSQNVTNELINDVLKQLQADVADESDPRGSHAAIHSCA